MDGLPDERGAAGRCAGGGTAKASPVGASPDPAGQALSHSNPGVPHSNTPALATPEPTVKPIPSESGRSAPEYARPGNPESFSPNPLVKPLFHPRTPARTRKTPPTTPRFAGPAPTSTTWIPDAVGQYPGGPRSEDDPCLGLRRLRTGGAFGSSIDTASVRQGQYPCAGSGGVFLSFRDSSPRSPARRAAKTAAAPPPAMGRRRRFRGGAGAPPWGRPRPDSGRGRPPRPPRRTPRLRPCPGGPSSPAGG